MPRAFKISTGRDWSSWPVLMMLLTVLVPSLGVVWMMRAAMESERLAVRQRLADAYRVQLEAANQSFVEQWREQLAALEATAGELPSPEAFQRCVTFGKCDGAVVLDVEGGIAYPNVAATSTPSLSAADDLAWQNAQRKEFAEGDLVGAAEAYGRIAEDASDESLVARAEQAQARSLIQRGRRDEAIAVLERMRARTGAIDLVGRSLSADAELRLLEIVGPESTKGRAIREGLERRLQSYGDSKLPADQRLFLMHRLQEIDGAEYGMTLPTLPAEELAADFVASGGDFKRDGKLRRSSVDDIWSVAAPQGRIVALYRTSTIESQLEKLLAQQRLPAGVTMEARRPGASDDAGEDLSTIALGEPLAGWRLAMRSTSGQLFDDAATARRALLAWVAGVLLAVTLAMTWFVASAVRRQMRTARLKNDLVATVSHELKTPLASIRLLVDTLLEGDGVSNGTASVNGLGREYLQLISHENSRLTRLIDNFLTFSRMDRGKHRFAKESIDAREIVTQAIAAVGDRFDGIKNRLVVDTMPQAGEPDLRVRGDVDALVTAVVNLLDNAWKYSGEHKQVRLSTRRAGDRVVIEVQDNGVGLSPRAARKVFERFYQVDQRLSRTQAGCGLGLSIVRFIVEAHGGTATVQSAPGEGCRFILTLPAEKDGESNEGSEWSLKRPVQRGAHHEGGASDK
ncbi:MAG: HAMP domain-containing histidine kinase [Pirellulales bacterium]|nr:HAMP domain-containing histidine kinase [Pirellulales bacterium]